ncbi:MAG: deoxyribonuclease IV [Muribaculum sp.]|nr:deoxyribonuclease IV [Muribaculaceae bacterium]MCM1080790.1 deoxyribonuclease IV [Muribaculum sp.]
MSIENKYIGAHVGVVGGVASAPVNASNIGAKAFALFTRNPSRWVAKPIPEKEAELFKQRCAELGFKPEQILPHDSFLINLGSPDKEKLELSRTAFLDEISRCMQLGLTMLNFHPGSHLKQMAVDDCLNLIADSINKSLEQTSGVKAVIECTAGQGSNLGYSFEQIAHIIDKVDDKSRVGVCIDTCHAFAAGYDLATAEGYADTWRHFDETIGASYLSGIHLNDSKKGRGSKVDRHAPIGQGTLGTPFFEMLVNDPRTDNIPIILETPDESLWPAEIASLYKMIH